MTPIACKLLDPKCLPVRKTVGAAAYDLIVRETTFVLPGEIAKVPLGVCLALPPGYYAEIRPRSGLTCDGIIVQLGTIDSDYRGELHAIVHNVRAPGEDFFAQRHMRIAQLLIARAHVPATDMPAFEVRDSLDETERGEGGFGSTGLE